MLRRNLLFLVLGGAIVLVWALLNLRAEPVDAISEKWSESAHADRTSESFVHWDADEPPLVPASCAKCHSLNGYLDFLGQDGTTPGIVDNAAQIDSVINCNACHNPAAQQMTEVSFPSQITITDLGAEAVCMQCHQGRASGIGVGETLAGLDEDTPNEDLGFVNIHYYIASATQQGADAHGGYQYPNRDYTGRFEHAEGMQTCVQCHDSHSLQVPAKSCSPCHLNVVDHEDLAHIRTEKNDYDGDGDVAEGVKDEITGMREILYSAIQEYAAEILGAPIVYGPETYPYFFVDSDNDRQADPDEINYANRYITWTPRLVRTVYNFHLVGKDPGGFAHNPEYLLELLHDSLADLGEAIPIDSSNLTRP